MKEIISTVEVVTDAIKKGESNKILFKEIRSTSHVSSDTEEFAMNSYKVYYDDEGNEVLEFLRNHHQYLTREEADTLYGSLSLSKTDYTELRKEMLLKGAKKFIGSNAIFGLTENQLIIR